MSAENERTREDRESYLDGFEQHVVNTLKLAGEGAMGISLDSLRAEILDELSMALVCARNLRELEAKAGTIGKEPLAPQNAANVNDGSQKIGVSEASTAKPAPPKRAGVLEVDQEQMERIEDAFGEIIQQMPHLREPSSPEWACAIEAAAEGFSIARTVLGKCFNPDCIEAAE